MTAPNNTLSKEQLERMADSRSMVNAEKRLAVIPGEINFLPVPKEGIPEEGLIPTLLRYWQGFNESSDAFLLASAFNLISGIAGLSNKFWMEAGVKMRLNLFSIIVGPSTISKKSTALRLPVSMANNAGFTDFIFPASTPEGLMHLASDGQEKPIRSGVWIEDEMEGFLRKMNKDYNVGLKQALLSAYDGATFSSHTKAKGTVKGHFDSLSFLAATTPATNVFTTEDSENGWMARFLPWCTSTHSGRCFPFRPNPDQKLKMQLECELQLISGDINTQELFFTKEAVQEYTEWYKREREVRAESTLNSFYSRNEMHVKKLSAIMAVAEHQQEISREHVKRAIILIGWFRENAKKLMGVQELSTFDRYYLKVEMALLEIASKGDGTVTRRLLNQKLGKSLTFLEPYILEAQARGIITIENRKPERGRMVVFYRVLEE